MLAGDDMFKKDCWALRFANELAYLKALLAMKADEAAWSAEPPPLLLTGGETEEVDEDDEEDEEDDDVEVFIVGKMMPLDIKLA